MKRNIPGGAKGHPGIKKAAKVVPAARLTEARLKMMEDKKLLPAYASRSEILDAVRKHSTVILVGETGSGKTTQIPQYLHEAQYTRAGMVGVTQPRRVAAMTVARRVAEEVGTEVGREVGYTIRFEDKTSKATKIKFMTDGMLMREIIVDPLLKRYKVIMLDEAHERTVHTDVLFGLVRRIQQERKDLKVIVMSATLEAESFKEYFGAHVVHVKGRQFPVEVMYTEAPEPDYVDAAVIATLQVHMDEPAGDILVFLTGQEEIESVERILNERCTKLPPETPKLVVCPIFAAMPPEQQLRAFSPVEPGCRKVVLATNIAETSITINGIRYVIDPGLVKQRTYHARSGVDSLIVSPISKAQARQRSGRAGREAAGKAFRLYTEDTFDTLSDFTVPEIKRCNLASIVMELKAMGVEDVLNFGFMDKPPRESLVKALELLLALGALGRDGRLSPTGKNMARFPLEPTLAKVILKSEELGCLEEVLTIVSMLTTDGSPFYSPPSKKEKADAAKRRFIHPDGDHLTSLNVYNAYQEVKGDRDWVRENFVNVRCIRKAMDIRHQLRRICLENKMAITSCGSDTEPIRKALVAGFFVNVASRQPDGTYKTLAYSQSVGLHPTSVLFHQKHDYILYNELVFTSKYYMRDCITVELPWLIEMAPSMYAKRTN